VGGGVAGEWEEFGFEATLGEEDAQEVYAGERGGVAVDGFDLVERFLVGEENAFDFAKARDGDAVQNVVTIVEEDFGDTEERRVKFVGREHLAEFGRNDKLDFVFEAACQRDGIQVRNGADAEGSERLAEAIFALELSSAVFAFVTLG
jgi:hypothetical protein